MWYARGAVLGSQFVLALALLQANAWATELADSKNYYPLEEGNTWTYEMTVRGQ